jgi:Amt family ammonium transporter
MTGALAAISAGAGVVAAPWAVAIGAVAGVLAPVAALWIDLIVRIDDPAGGVAIHAVGGAWGTLAVGLFAPGGLAARFKHLGVQAVGLVAIAIVAAGLSLALFAVLRATVGVRAKEADEFDGLDLAEHDIGAYPDFQQNTIRSYHLRET